MTKTPKTKKGPKRSQCSRTSRNTSRILLMANSKLSVYVEDDSTTKSTIPKQHRLRRLLTTQDAPSKRIPYGAFYSNPFGPTHQAHAIHVHCGGILYKISKGTCLDCEFYQVALICHGCTKKLNPAYLGI